MTSPFDLDGPRFRPASGQAAQQLVVLLHGVGADGNDLIALAPYFAQALPDAAFASPHAPFPFDMAPVGRQWFSLQERTPEAMLAGVRAAAPILEAFLEAELARHGLAADRLALIGFSQGTMMSLYLGLRRTPAVAGIVGYSGALLAPDLLPAEIAARPPVLLIHGDSDEVVPPQSLPAAVAALQANGVAVAHELRPGLAHSIDERGIQLAMAFLAEIFGTAPQTSD